MMTKTTVKKRKTRPALKKAHRSPAKKARVVRRKIPKSLLSGPQGRRGKKLAYYALAGVAVVVGLLFTVYENWMTSRRTQGSNTSSYSGSSAAGLLTSEFKEAQSLDSQERIKFWSGFLEKDSASRQRVSALVTGYQVDDTAPIVPDKYDCTTFVETVAALARSEKSEDFLSNLLAIRYRDGKPGFFTRNHFPEVDWIPNNERAKILTDITSQVAQTSEVGIKIERKQIDKEKWLKAQIDQRQVSRTLASVNNSGWSVPIEAQVSYIEIAKVKNILKRIPSGAVINLVHPNKGEHPVLITHQGFIVRDGDQVFLRHASTGGRIRTDELSTYLARLVRFQKKTSKWPMIGVNFNQINFSTSAKSRLSESL